MIRQIWNNEKFRYLIIGAYNTLVGYGTFVLLWIFLGHTVHYMVILVISHIISVINAFLGYRILVFRKKGNLWVDFIKFNLVYLGAFLINILILPILIEFLNFHPLLAQAVIIAVTVVITYFLHSRFSFNIKRN